MLLQKIYKFIENLYFKIPNNLALYDQLTGIYNYNWYVINAIDKYGDKECYITMIDLNNFKHINDTEGHLYANGILKGVALKLNELKVYDKTLDAIRFGGDEFIVFSSIDLTRFFEVENSKLISYGIVKKQATTPLEVSIRLADEHMYEYKRKLKKKKNH